MRKILITGGAGFIGSNFVEHLFENYPGYRLLILDALTYAGTLDNFPEKIKNDSRFSFWQGDITNPEIVNELVAQVDTVIHFAAETHVARSIFDEKRFFITDVIGTQVVANAVLKNPVDRFVHISSSEVYGTSKMDHMTEEHPLNPTSPYASAKSGADRLVYSYYVAYGVPAVIVRPFNNYGPKQHLEKVTPRFITSALLNENLVIHGEGSSSRDWLFVKDHCLALDKILHIDVAKVKGEAINIGTGRDLDIITIARMIRERVPKSKSQFIFGEDRQGQVMRHNASTEKAFKILGWKAETPYEEGITKTIEWYQKNETWWKKLLWMRSVPMRMADGKEVYY
ncbi:MAG: epimerase [Candidatus Schekmanbacteria bacterium RBG_13_48_7]|uniref:Epimerase n=1 Tax=Candidatus Schekmanbacteria bacterium RBG_13_48_7 TaxID=1817878 RepID=A0A1F7RZC9_9BACT|nr:MAG: epimerase [Candidatus Schekmanbacteria bacterium RBG_13_48_7]